MNPTSKKTTFFGLAVLVVLVLFFVVSIKRGALPDDKFTPPVYVQDESPTALIRPLYLESLGGKPTALSQEQKQLVADFKKKILIRIASRAPLTSQEKTVLAISTATTAKPAIGDFLVADQSVFQFSADELKEIARAME